LSLQALLLLPYGVFPQSTVSHAPFTYSINCVVLYTPTSVAAHFPKQIGQQQFLIRFGLEESASFLLALLFLPFLSQLSPSGVLMLLQAKHLFL
jgi:hypothetical protein